MHPSMQPDVGEGVAVLSGCFLVFVILFSLLVTGLTVWACCRIFAKTGFSWALGLLMLIPIANVIILFIMLFVLAFAEWPIERELQQMRQVQSGPGS